MSTREAKLGKKTRRPARAAVAPQNGAVMQEERMAPQQALPAAEASYSADAAMDDEFAGSHGDDDSSDDDDAAAADDDEGDHPAGVSAGGDDAAQDGENEEDVEEDSIGSDLDGGDGAGSSGSDADNEEDNSRYSPGGHKQPASGGKFTEGGRGISFAKAMAKILGSGRDSRRAAAAAAKKTEEQAATTPGTTAKEAGDLATTKTIAGLLAVPILAESRSTHKRQAEDEAEGLARKEARRERLELRKRGHVRVPKRGQNPVHDKLEKQLAHVATQGVVMLFNAVSAAQRDSQDALASAKKVPKLSKASFLKQLRAGAGGPDEAKLTGSAPGAGAAAAAVQRTAPGWKVLQEGFTGLAGGSKMKEWDKEAEEDSGAEQEQLEGSQSSESDGGNDNGW